MSYNIREQLGWQSPQSNYFNSYVTKTNPPLDTSHLKLDLLAGEEREVLQTPTVGSSSFALWYKGAEGAVISLEEKESDLVVLQVQGAKSRKSYRLSTGLDWVRLFADQVSSVVDNPTSPFQRLVMPAPFAIEGLLEELGKREDVVLKYARFAAQAGLGFSQLEQSYIRDLKKM